MVSKFGLFGLLMEKTHENSTYHNILSKDGLNSTMVTVSSSLSPSSKRWFFMVQVSPFRIKCRTDTQCLFIIANLETISLVGWFVCLNFNRQKNTKCLFQQESPFNWLIRHAFVWSRLLCTDFRSDPQWKCQVDKKYRQIFHSKSKWSQKQ